MTREAADKVLAQDKDAVLVAIYKIIERIKEGTFTGDAEFYQHISIESGWSVMVDTYKIEATYMNDMPDLETFFVPTVTVTITPCLNPSDPDVLEESYETVERYPYGYCSCGKPIPIVQEVLLLEEMDKKGGIYSVMASIRGLVFALRLVLNPELKHSLTYHRHPGCPD